MTGSLNQGEMAQDFDVETKDGDEENDPVRLPTTPVKDI